MALRTSSEYAEKLAGMEPNVYVGGRKISRDDEILRTPLNTIGFTFDAAADPELSPLATAKSHLDGKVINRFTHVHRSIDDLMVKQEMTRVLCRKVGGCIQRCMAADTLNAMGVVSKEIGDAPGA